jgi:hypothetical protein
LANSGESPPLWSKRTLLYFTENGSGIWLAPVDQDDRWQPSRWLNIKGQLQYPQRQLQPLLLASNPQLCNSDLEWLADPLKRFSIQPLTAFPASKTPSSKAHSQIQSSLASDSAQHLP